MRYVYFVDVFRSFLKLADLGGMMENDRSYWRMGIILPLERINQIPGPRVLGSHPRGGDKSVFRSHHHQSGNKLEG